MDIIVVTAMIHNVVLATEGEVQLVKIVLVKDLDPYFGFNNGFPNISCMSYTLVWNKYRIL